MKGDSGWFWYALNYHYDLPGCGKWVQEDTNRLPCQGTPKIIYETVKESGEPYLCTWETFYKAKRPGTLQGKLVPCQGPKKAPVLCGSVISVLVIAQHSKHPKENS